MNSEGLLSCTVFFQGGAIMMHPPVVTIMITLNRKYCTLISEALNDKPDHWEVERQFYC